jgi:hypothetical protein
VSVIDQLGQIWNQVLDFMSKIVIPDWGALIGLLPIFVLIGVVGPLLSLLALVWVVYVARRPRASLAVVEGPRPARLDAGGQPVYPTGEPYCARDGLVYPFGQTTCDQCHGELVVTCPKCGIGRQARIETCDNCGLILRVDPRAQQRALAPAGPPPGGAAVA